MRPRCRTPGAQSAKSSRTAGSIGVNASEALHWDIVSNGLNLRLLRDNVALTRLAFVEFDLRAMFDGDLYSEFFVLARLPSVAFRGREARAILVGTLEKSAEDKTLTPSTTFIPASKGHRRFGAGLVSNRQWSSAGKLRTGRLTTQEFYKQVLRVILPDADLLHLRWLLRPGAPP